jgi:site-specific DNA-methyltransferase (adenine-specific)
MKPYYEKDAILVYQADCLVAMKELADNSIDTILTDPPYGLQFMGKDWDKLWRNKNSADKAYQDKNKGKLTSRQRNLPDYSSTDQVVMQQWHYEWAKECLRVAKPGAILMAFGGTRTYHRMVCAIEDAGWEIRDCITYFHDASFQEMSFMASLDEEQLAAYLELHYPNLQLHWVYGSGFPKSLDIGKKLDHLNYSEREKKIKDALAAKGYTNVVWSNDHE